MELFFILIIGLVIAVASSAWMTAAVDALTFNEKPGEDIDYPIQANVLIKAGHGVTVGDADIFAAGVSGHIKTALAADVATHRFVGIAQLDGDNTVDGGGAAAAFSRSVRVQGSVNMIFGSVLITDVGKDAYLIDNQTCQVTPTNAGYNIGEIVAFVDGTHAYVQLRRQGARRRVVITAEYEPLSVDKRVFQAHRPMLVRAIKGTVNVAGNDGGAVNVQPRKVISGQAITAGDALTTAVMDLKGAADTVQNLVKSATPADLVLNTDDCIALDFTGTLTLASGVVAFEMYEL